MVDNPFLYPFGQLVLLNGIFHWVESPTYYSGLPRGIASFDLVSETFKEIQLPQELLDRRKFSVLNLWLFEGCLYLIGSMYMVGVEVWTMKQYGVKESWTKMLVVDGDTFGVGYIDLKNSLGNGVILVQADHLFPFLYDLNKEEARQLKIDGIKPPFFTWAFLGSLISPTFGTCLEAQ
ncbi:F-box/kelch-repeat protein At3g06240-like [Papaver somniferum]|uniref:F-box/kelch-repeat protein At3g06240-like n=1 Tax=Papaver somniferum TaxID=3469 RepID=UPI000E703EF4|nr:F-box/kelch-repeat protein At3g06240-like [Papaver somniferum]